MIVLFWQLNLFIACLIGAPSVFANKKAIRDALRLADLKKNETLIDLGCGDARSLIIAANDFQAKGIGVERSIYCYLLARIRILLVGKKQAQILFGNYKKYGKALQKADVVYLYLLNSVMKNIEPWLFNNMKPGARIVSLAFPFPGHKPKKYSNSFNLGRETKIYLYQKI